MKTSTSILALAAAAISFAITGCDRPVVVTPPATVVSTPPTVAVPVPGPAGAPGAPGAPGATGAPGSDGKPGDSTTVIVTPKP